MRFGQWVAAAVLAGTIGGALAHPRCAWLARTHLGTLVGSGIDGFTPEAKRTPRSAPAEALPDNVELAFGRALQRYASSEVDRVGDLGDPAARLTPLLDVVRRWPEHSGARAAYLRLSTQQAVRLGREDEMRRAEGKSPVPGRTSRPATTSRPVDLAQFDEVASEGERRDPDNAFFPAMRALGHLAAGEDAAAWRDLHRAAGRPAWREYVDQEALAGDRFAAARGRGFGAISRVARTASILFPHYAGLRSVARLALGEAVRRETSGDPRGGIALREDVSAVGRRMRDHSTFLIGNLVGIAVNALAQSRPGGVDLPKKDKDAAQDDAARRAIEDLRTARYAAWLGKNGATPATIDAAREDLRIARDIRSVSNQGMSRGVYDMQAMAITMLALLSGALVLGNVAQMLLVRGAAEVAVRCTAIGRGGRLAPGTFAGGLVGLALLQLPFALLVGKSLGAGVAGMRGITTGAPENADPVGMLAGVAVGAVATYLVPALAFGFLLLRAALTRKASFSRTVVLGMRGAALPIAALLAVGYAGALAWGLGRDADLNAGWERMLRHAGRYCAEFAGKPWPGDR